MKTHPIWNLIFAGLAVLMTSHALTAAGVPLVAHSPLVTFVGGLAYVLAEQSQERLRSHGGQHRHVHRHG